MWGFPTASHLLEAKAQEEGMELLGGPPLEAQASSPPSGSTEAVTAQPRELGSLQT